MKWFKHDSDAYRDPKIKKVIMRYGVQGYGLYWYCLELIAETIDRHNVSFELEHDCEILAHDLKMDTLKVEEIMRYFIELGLFEYQASRDKITCLQLAKRIENSVVKSPEIKKIQEQLAQSEGRKADAIPELPGSSGTTREKRCLDIDLDLELEKPKTIPAELPPGGGEDRGRAKPANKTCPIQEIVDLWNSICTNLPRVRVISPQVENQLRQRWKSDERYQDMDFWRWLFWYVNQNQFLAHQQPTAERAKPWRASLEFVTRAGKFAKILNEEF